jgi:hypothetical protein
MGGKEPGKVVRVERQSLVVTVGIVATLAIALIPISTVILTSLLAKPDTGPATIELDAVDVSFAGSGSRNATLAQNACGCGASYEVGSSITQVFEVEVPPVGNPTCDRLPHTYSITQVAGPASGGFQVTGIRGEYPVADVTLSPLPASLPGCPNGTSPVNGVQFYVSVAVVNAGPTVQTLNLNVTVTQVS